MRGCAADSRAGSARDGKKPAVVLDDLLAAHRLLVGPRKRAGAGGGIAAVVRESHSDRQSTLLVRTDGPIADPAWSVHEVDLEELILAYMGEQHEPRLQSLPRLEANG